ncbi:MAG: hypothetical protein HOI88_06140 [Phycisphaerae bacterium]|jgi:hypothetical protein|nr:hypothetical protein [Phycisphaerae bacterium]
MKNDSLVIALSICVSVGIHALLLPIVSASESLAHSPTTKATHLETPKLDEPEIELGIDNSTTSTLTWIGYDEYKEQRARFSEVEQAEMETNEPVSSSAPVQEQVKQEPNPDKKTVDQYLDSLHNFPFSKSKNKPEKQQEIEMSGQLAQGQEEIVLEEEVKPAVPVEPTEPMEPAEPHNNPSDRDSEATSVIQISPEQWKLGKPLAANGIVLRPKRPSFTANQTVSNIAGNLGADLIINKHGKPANVVIRMSTGSFSIDRTIESSLYRWRASGEKIDALVGDETITITINILFR